MTHKGGLHLPVITLTPHLPVVPEIFFLRFRLKLKIHVIIPGKFQTHTLSIL